MHSPSATSSAVDREVAPQHARRRATAPRRLRAERAAARARRPRDRRRAPTRRSARAARAAAAPTRAAGSRARRLRRGPSLATAPRPAPVPAGARGATTLIRRAPPRAARAPARAARPPPRRSAARGRGRADLELAAHAPRARREHDHAVGEQRRLLDVVGDQHDRARLAQRARRASHSCISARVIASSAPNGSSRHSTGLPDEQRAQERDALAHPARELARVRAARSRRGRARRTAPRARSRACARGRAGDAQRERGVVERVEPRQQQVALGHQHGRRRARACPASRRLQAADQLEQRRLAAAGGPDDARAPRPRSASQRHAVERLHACARGGRGSCATTSRTRSASAAARSPAGGSSAGPALRLTRRSLRGHYPTGSKGRRRGNRVPVAPSQPAFPPAPLVSTPRDATLMSTRPTLPRRAGLALGGDDGPRQRAHEVLELRGRPALERRAVLLVGGDHRVAVVPVQARLGVQPERAPGARGDLRRRCRRAGRGRWCARRRARSPSRAGAGRPRPARGTPTTRGRSRCSRRCRPRPRRWRCVR